MHMSIKGIKYSPQTGMMYRIYKNKQKPALGGHGDGYKRIQLNGQRYLQHRLAWYIIYGEWVEMIDHINGDKMDNRIDNLRPANKKVNALNQERHRQGKLAGVRFHKARTIRPYEAYTSRTKGKQYSLGYYDTEQEAHQVYLESERRCECSSN